MEKTRTEILQRHIINYTLREEDSELWVKYFQIGDVIYNPTGSTITDGYYVYSGVTQWGGPFTKPEVSYTFDLPIFLEEEFDDMGVMVGFDGEVGQTEQKCNFTYSGNGNFVTVYNTVNTTITPTLVDVLYTLDWGDGSPTETLPAVHIGDLDLPSLTHEYTGVTGTTLMLTLNSPWEVNEVKKSIELPFISSYGFPTDLGTLTFKVPYTEEEIEQTYLQDYRELTGNTENVTISFLGVGKSRVDEFKKYGDNDEYSGITITSGYTGYTIDGLEYRDYPDNYTYISGTTEEYYFDEIYNGMITRNEHFLGFVDEPTIYSDIFVDRGKLGVMEKNFRLSEIESTGELENYGNGYFNIIES